jgi:hypothetical protein
MKIKVTQQDIQNGKSKRRHPDMCPVALAFIRVLGRDVMVGPRMVFFVGLLEESANIDWKLPGQVRKFISDFDNDVPVEPIEFDFPDELFEKVKA